MMQRCPLYPHAVHLVPRGRQVDDITGLWTDDMVGFLLGCSFSWEVLKKSPCTPSLPLPLPCMCRLATTAAAAATAATAAAASLPHVCIGPDSPSSVLQ